MATYDYSKPSYRKNEETTSYGDKTLGTQIACLPNDYIKYEGVELMKSCKLIDFAGCIERSQW